MKTLIYTLLTSIFLIGTGASAANDPIRLAGAHTDKGAQQAEGERGGKPADKGKGDKDRKRDGSCGKNGDDCEPGERGKKKGHEQGKGMDKGEKKGLEQGKGNQN